MISTRRFCVGSGFLLMVSLLIFLGRERMLACLLTAAAAHEAGHIAVLYAVGGRIKHFTLGFTGMAIEQEPGRAGYMAEAAVAGAGPAAGFVFAAAASRVPGWEAIAGMSLCLSILNLLPCYPLDGGRILYALISSCFGQDAAYRVMTVCSCLSALTLLSVGIWSALHGWGFLLIITGTWLLMNTVNPRGA